MAEELEQPLEIDQIETSSLGREKVLVRIVGRWQGRRRAPEGRAFLVVKTDGRRHRFPAMPEPRRSRFGRPGQWDASFALPAWLEPRLSSDMSLWIGNTAIQLPSVQTAEEPASLNGETPVANPVPEAQAPEADPAPAREPAARPAREPAARPAREPAARPAREPASPPPRGSRAREATRPARAAARVPVAAAAAQVAEAAGAPPPAGTAAVVPAAMSADQETVTALRAELKQRAAAEAQLRGLLAGVNAELQASTARQEKLEAIHGELKGELEGLVGLVEQEGARRAAVESRAVVLAAEVAELQARLADLTEARDALTEEVTQLRGELQHAGQEAEQHRDELVRLREAAERESAERTVLESREAELNGQLANLRAELAQSTVTSEAALGEAAGLRAELDRLGGEIAAAREGSSGAGGLDEAQSLLEEARALSAQLRERGSPDPPE